VKPRSAGTVVQTELLTGAALVEARRRVMRPFVIAEGPGFAYA
jgi:hypothetical protein